MTLKDKKLFLFDIDGTLGVGSRLFAGSRELLQYIEDIGGQSYFITNNSTKSRKDYVEKFSQWKLQVEENQFITSGFMAIQFMKRHFADKKIFVLGTRSFIEDLRREQLLVTEELEEDIACVLVGYDSELTYAKLCVACEVLSLRKDIPYYATNPDLCCPAPFGFIPDCGSMCELLMHSTKRMPVYLGKPNKEVAEICLSQSGLKRMQALVVGDRLYTDIACGIAAGMDTCILFTGEARSEDLSNTRFVPTYAFQTILELLESCRKDH